MSKKDNYFHQKLGLDNKNSGAIRLLLDEGLCPPSHLLIKCFKLIHLNKTYE